VAVARLAKKPGGASRWGAFGNQAAARCQRAPLDDTAAPGCRHAAAPPHTLSTTSRVETDEKSYHTIP
jgi:hypothetical protein